MTPLIAITVGDIDGIGPEVALKSVRRYRGKATPFLVGPSDVFLYYARCCHMTFRFDVSDGKGDIRAFVRNSWKLRRIPIVERDHAG